VVDSAHTAPAGEVTQRKKAQASKKILSGDPVDSKIWAFRSRNGAASRAAPIDDNLVRQRAPPR
jgi:hypothetical protein